MYPYVMSLWLSIGILLYCMKKMVSVHLNSLPKPCANLTSLFANECFQTFLCWLFFIRCLYSIAAHVYGFIMEFLTFSSETGEALPQSCIELQ